MVLGIDLLDILVPSELLQVLVTCEKLLELGLPLHARLLFLPHTRRELNDFLNYLVLGHTCCYYLRLLLFCILVNVVLLVRHRRRLDAHSTDRGKLQGLALRRHLTLSGLVGLRGDLLLLLLPLESLGHISIMLSLLSEGLDRLELIERLFAHQRSRSPIGLHCALR